MCSAPRSPTAPRRLRPAPHPPVLEALEAAIARAQVHLEQEAWGPLLAALAEPLAHRPGVPRSEASRAAQGHPVTTALNLAGVAHEALGRPELAERAWSEAVRWRYQAAPYVNLLALLNAQGRHREALALAERLEGEVPPHGSDWARARCQRGLAHLGLGDARAAARPFRELHDAYVRTHASELAAVRAALEAFAAGGHRHAPLARDVLAWLGKERPGAVPGGEAAARRAWWDGLARVLGDWPRWCRSVLGLAAGRVPSDAQLAELAHARLLILDLHGEAGVDLSPLGAFTALEELRVIGKPVRGVERLGGLTTLRRLVLFGCGLTSVEWVARLPALEALDLNGNAVADLSPLAGSRALRVLNLDRNGLEDLSPLARLAHLRVLECEGNRVASVAPLAGLEALEELRLDGNPLRDVGPLAGCRALRVLSCASDEEVGGLEALAGLERLRELSGVFPDAALGAFRAARRGVRVV